MKDLIIDAINKAISDYETTLSVQLTIPKEREHGDYSTNVAMILAKPLNENPINLANTLVEKLNVILDGKVISEVAGPGFINFKIEADANRIIFNTLFSNAK